MPRVFASLVLILPLAGCTALPRQADSQLSQSDLRSVVRAVKERDPTCAPTIHLVSACPARYQDSQKGECILAFDHGTSVNDPKAIFYTVYLNGSSATAYEKVPGGRENETEIMGIVSGCPH